MMRPGLTTLLVLGLALVLCQSAFAQGRGAPPPGPNDFFTYDYRATESEKIPDTPPVVTHHQITLAGQAISRNLVRSACSSPRQRATGTNSCFHGQSHSGGRGTVTSVSRDCVRDTGDCPFAAPAHSQ